MQKKSIDIKDDTFPEKPDDTWHMLVVVVFFFLASFEQAILPKMSATVVGSEAHV